MNEFSQYIKTIGKGKRAGRYLTQTEAYQAFRLLLNNEVEPEQAGAFLMLLRVREESAEELAGFVQACREFNTPMLDTLNTDIDMGCYAGKRRHLPWFLLAVKCLAKSGKRIFLHGTKEPESNRLYLSEVLKTLKLPISSNIESARKSLDENGFSYMDLHTVNPELDRLIQMRSLFGLRSPANTLARMLNPSQSSYSYHGVFHREFDERHIEVARLLGDNGVSCIRGEGGEVEVNPERAFTQYLRLNDAVKTVEFPALLQQWQIKPKQLEPAELAQLWQGQLDYEYGEQAVIGTIASYLTLMESLDLDAALKKAGEMWRTRLEGADLV